jgi:hypothetical protein
LPRPAKGIKISRRAFCTGSRDPRSIRKGPHKDTGLSDQGVHPFLQEGGSIVVLPMSTTHQEAIVPVTKQNIRGSDRPAPRHPRTEPHGGLPRLFPTPRRLRPIKASWEAPDGEKDRVPGHWLGKFPTGMNVLRGLLPLARTETGAKATLSETVAPPGKDGWSTAPKLRENAKSDSAEAALPTIFRRMRSRSKAGPVDRSTPLPSGNRPSLAGRHGAGPHETESARPSGRFHQATPKTCLLRNPVREKEKSLSDGRRSNPDGSDPMILSLREPD